MDHTLSSKGPGCRNPTAYTSVKKRWGIRLCFGIVCPLEQPFHRQIGSQVGFPKEPLRRPGGSPNLHNAPNGPHVHLETVPFLAQHLRSYVIRSSAQGLLPFPVVFHLGCQSKIPWDRGRKGRTQMLASVICQHRLPLWSCWTPENQGHLSPQALLLYAARPPQESPTMLAQGGRLSMTPAPRNPCS